MESRLRKGLKALLPSCETLTSSPLPHIRVSRNALLYHRRRGLAQNGYWFVGSSQISLSVSLGQALAV